MWNGKKCWELNEYEQGQRKGKSEAAKILVTTIAKHRIIENLLLLAFLGVVFGVAAAVIGFN